MPTTINDTILRAESNTRHTAFCKKAFDELKPLGFLEEQAVQTIADTQWRLNLGRALESNLHPLHGDAIDSTEALTITKSLANLSTYEHRLTRILENAKKELAELQKIRRDRDASELDTAINMRRYSLIHKLEWEPADHGFVFTIAELDAHLRRNTRRDKANDFVRWNTLVNAK